MDALTCLFVGVCTQDLIFRIDALPGHNQRVAASQFLRCCGGVAANAAAAFAHLGGVAGVITAVGDDDTGDFIRRDLQRQQYGYLAVHTIPGCPSPISAIQVEADGSRSITHFGGSIQILTPETIDFGAVAASKMVHMGVMPIPTMLAIARFAKENGGPILSVDGGNLSKDAMDALLPYVDIFIPDEATVKRALGLSAEDACAYFREKGVRIACVTLGEEGVLSLDDSGFCRRRALNVNVVDTTAAGDNFHGAFLWALSEGQPLPQALEFAAAFASLTCEELGGRAGMKSSEEVRARQLQSNN